MQNGHGRANRRRPRRRQSEGGDSDDSDSENDDDDDSHLGKRGRSLVYKLFEKQPDGKAKCILCSKMLSSTHGSTSAMRRHAASNHWAEWEMVQSDAGVFSKVPSKKLKRKSFSTPQKVKKY